MSINVIRSEAQRKQNAIWGTIRNLRSLPKVNTHFDKDGETIKTISITSDQTYVPDFHLEWCDNKEHYRVYIHIASRDYDKQNAGYCICTIGSPLTSMMFAMFFQFLHKNRPNVKVQA